jgi:hypothetical protein
MIFTVENLQRIKILFFHSIECLERTGDQERNVNSLSNENDILVVDSVSTTSSSHKILVFSS